jgi:cyclophilin family peptidyl-prolyl cis-trans isomerase
VIPNFLVQFGISYNSEIKHQKTIPDDPQRDPPIPFDTGIISFAGYGPNSRTSQLFIAYGTSKSLGREPWETPLGRVTEGMEVAKAWYSYGDGGARGPGPDQSRIWNGPQYIENNFPLTDSFETCQVERRSLDEIEPNRAEQGSTAVHRSRSDNEVPVQGEVSSLQEVLETKEAGTPLPIMQVTGLLLLLAVVAFLFRPSRKAGRKLS